MAPPLNLFAEEILKIHGKDATYLKEHNLEVSELNLLMNSQGSFVLEFEAYGQSFMLTESGVFTFDELGNLFRPKPSFRKSLESFLTWRLAGLRTFQL